MPLSLFPSGLWEKHNTPRPLLTAIYNFGSPSSRAIHLYFTPAAVLLCLMPAQPAYKCAGCIADVYSNCSVCFQQRQIFIRTGAIAPKPGWGPSCAGLFVFPWDRMTGNEFVHSDRRKDEPDPPLDANRYARSSYIIHCRRAMFIWLLICASQLRLKDPAHGDKPRQVIMCVQ